MTDMHSATVKFNADTRNFEKGFNKVSKSMSGIEDTVERLSDSITKKIGAAIAAIGAITIGSGAVKAFAEFEESLNELQAKAGLTKEELKKVGDFAIQMGSKTIFSATEASQALIELAASGLSVQESMALLPSIMDGAAASGASLKTVADGLTDVLDAFQAPIEEASEVIDTLNRATLSSSATFEGMISAFQNVGGTAKMAGLSIEETAATLAILHENGIKGAEAGTQLRAMLNNMFTRAPAQNELRKLGVSLAYTTEEIIALSKEMGSPAIGKWVDGIAMGEKQIAKLEVSIEATKKKIKGLERQAARGEDVDATLAMARRELEQLESEFSQRFVKKRRFVFDEDALAALGLPSVGQIKPIDTIIKDIAKKLEGMNEVQKFQAIKTIAGVYGQLGLQALLSADGIDEMTRAMSEQASVREIAAQRMESLSNTFKNFQGSLETLFITLFSPLAEYVVKPLLLALTSILNFITGVLRGTETVESVFNRLRKIALSIKEFFVGLLKGLANVQEAPNDFLDAQEGLIPALEEKFAFTELLKRIGKRFKEDVGVLFSNFKKAFKKNIVTFSQSLGSLVDKLKKRIYAFFQEIKTFFSPRKQARELDFLVSNSVGASLDNALSMENLNSPFQTAIKQLKEKLKSLFKRWKEKIVDYYKNLSAFFKEKGEQLLDKLGIRNIIEKALLDDLGDSPFVKIAKKIKKAFETLLKDIVKAIKNFAKKLSNFLKKSPTEMLDSLKRWVSSIFESIKKAIEENPRILLVLGSAALAFVTAIKSGFLLALPKLILSLFLSGGAGLFGIFSKIMPSILEKVFSPSSFSQKNILEFFQKNDPLAIILSAFGAGLVKPLLAAAETVSKVGIVGAIKLFFEKLIAIIEEKFPEFVQGVKNVASSFSNLLANAILSAFDILGTPALSKKEKHLLDKLGIELTIEDKFALIKNKIAELYESFKTDTTTGKALAPFIDTFAASINNLLETDWATLTDYLVGFFAVFSGVQAGIFLAKVFLFTFAIRALGDVLRTIKERGLTGAIEDLKNLITKKVEEFQTWAKTELPSILDYTRELLKLAFLQLFDPQAWDDKGKTPERASLLQAEIEAIEKDIDDFEEKVPDFLKRIGDIFKELIKGIKQTSNSVRSVPVLGDIIRDVIEPFGSFVFIRPFEKLTKINFAELSNNLLKLFNVETSVDFGKATGLSDIIEFIKTLNSEHPEIIRSVAAAIGLLTTRLFGLGIFLRIGNIVTILKEITDAINALASAEGLSKAENLEEFASSLNRVAGILIIMRFNDVLSVLNGLINFNPTNSPLMTFIREIVNSNINALSSTFLNISDMFRNLSNAQTAGDAVRAITDSIVGLVRGIASIGFQILGITLLINAFNELFNIISILGSGDVSQVVDHIFPAVGSLIGSLIAFRIGNALADPEGFQRLVRALRGVREVVDEASTVLTDSRLSNLNPQQVADRITEIDEALTKSIPKINEVNPSLYKMKEQVTLLYDISNEIELMTRNMPEGQATSAAFSKLNQVKREIDLFVHGGAYDTLMEESGKIPSQILEDRRTLLSKLRELTDEAKVALHEAQRIEVPRGNVFTRLKNGLTNLGNAFTDFLKSEFVSTIRYGLGGISLSLGLMGIANGIRDIIQAAQGVEVNTISILEQFLSGLAGVFGGVVLANPKIITDAFNSLVNGVSKLFNVGTTTAIGFILSLLATLITFFTIKGEGNLIEGVSRLARELGRLLGIVPEVSKISSITETLLEMQPENTKAAFDAVGENWASLLTLALSRVDDNNRELEAAVKNAYERALLGFVSGTFDFEKHKSGFENALRSITNEIDPKQVQDIFLEGLGSTAKEWPPLTEILLEPYFNKQEEIIKGRFESKTASALSARLRSIIEQAIKEATPEQADQLLTNLFLDFEGLTIAANKSGEQLEDFVQNKIFGALGKRIIDLSDEKFGENFGEIIANTVFGTLELHGIEPSKELVTTLATKTVSLLEAAIKETNNTLEGYPFKELTSFEISSFINDWLFEEEAKLPPNVEEIIPTSIYSDLLQNSLTRALYKVRIGKTAADDPMFDLVRESGKLAAENFYAQFNEQLEFSFDKQSGQFSVKLAPKVKVEVEPTALDDAVTKTQSSIADATSKATAVEISAPIKPIVPSAEETAQLAVASTTALNFATHITTAETELSKMAPAIAEAANSTQTLKDKFGELTAFLSEKVTALFGEKGSFITLFRAAFGEEGTFTTLINNLFGESGVFVNGITGVQNKLSDLEKSGTTMANNIGAAFAPITGAMLTPFAEGIKRIGNLLINAAKSDGSGMLSALSILGSTLVTEAEKIKAMDTGGVGKAGKPYFVGAGAQPELVIPHTRSTFIPNADRLLKLLASTPQFSARQLLTQPSWTPVNTARNEKPANVVINITAEQDIDTTIRQVERAMRLRNRKFKLHFED